MSRSWELLEDAGGAAYAAAEWTRVLGDEHSAVAPFLRPVEHPLTALPCDRTRQGFACAYRVVGIGEDRYSAVCDESRCERRELKKADVEGRCWDLPKLGAALATVLKSPASVAVVADDPRILRISTRATEDGATCALVLVRGCDDLQTSGLLDRLRLECDGAAVIFFATARHVGANTEERLRRYRWGRLVLDQLLVFRPQGLVALAGAEDAVEDAIESVTGESVVSSKLNVPADCRWGEVAFTASVRDPEIFNVTIRDVRYRVTPGDLGLEDRRSRRGDVQWKFLHALARGRGRFDWEDAANHEVARKTKNRLSQALRSAFGIEADPIEWRKDEKAWVTAFEIGSK